MKRFLLLALGLTLASQMWADDYNQFLFRQTDGTETAVTAQSLKITFSDGKLVASAAEGVLSWPLSGLSAMRFCTASTSADTDADADADAIDGLTADGRSAEIAVYTLAGAKVAQGADAQSLVSSLPRGLYIVKDGQTAKKLMVR